MCVCVCVCVCMYICVCTKVWILVSFATIIIQYPFMS